MSTDVRTLLHDAAERPSREPDVDGALRAAHTRRRRHRGVVAAATVVVVALAVGGVALGTGGGGGPVSIHTLQTAPSIPDGWTTIDVGRGVQLSVPSGWSGFGLPDDALHAPGYMSVGIGSAPIKYGMGNWCQTIEAGGEWLVLYELPPETAEALGQKALPSINPAMTERPSDFAASTPAIADGSCPSTELRQWLFIDSGRYFLGWLLTPANHPDNVSLGEQVLNTLRVEPADSTTTTTVPTVSTTAPSPTAATTTTSPPDIGAGEDEAAIQQAYERWMDDQTDAGLDASTEDPDAVRRPSHEGWAQHSPDDLAQYEGRVESITLIDADHARVVYTILHGGQLAFANRTGTAVRLDGAWKVSTDTVCSMLSLGGITCPA
jgi:hypothetical protein